MLPAPTRRLRFREMGPADLDAMSSLLGDPEVMRFYPAPETREEAADWIAWNQRNYADRGYGLWIIETRSGEFVGDCGLTWQSVNGTSRLEVGYHVQVARQGSGLASEAASACRDLARDTMGEPELVSIIHPENLASRRVAEKIGMRKVDADYGGRIPVRVVMGMDL